MRGFTTIELVIVVILIGILAVYAVPRFDNATYDNADMRLQLVQALRYAQSQSMNNTGADNFTVTVAANGFSVTQNGNNVSNPYDGSASYIASWSNGTLSPTGTITFQGNGSPICGNGLNCANTNLSLNVTIGGHSSRVTLEHTTGYVR